MKKRDAGVKDVLAAYWHSMKPYKARVIFIFSLVIAAQAAGVALPIFYKYFIDALSAPGDVSQRFRSAFLILLGIVGVGVVSAVLQRIDGFLSAVLEPNIITGFYQSSFSQLLRQSYRFFTDNYSGSLIRKVWRFVGAFRGIYDNVKYTLFPNSIYLAGVLIIVFRKSLELGLVFLTWSVFVILFNYFFTKWKLRIDTERATADSEAGGYMSDVITNSLNVSLFTSRKMEEDGYGRLTRTWGALQTKSWKLMELNRGIQNIFDLTMEFAVMYFAIRLWAEGRLTIGDLVLLQAYLLNLFGMLHGISRILRSVFESVADAKEMVEILNTTPEVVDARGAKELRVRRGKIEFRGVTFDYANRRRVLDGFTFTVTPKQKVAFVGPSGAGKSTAVKLLLRFFDVAGGAIRIDGRDISQVTQDSLRRQIAFVPQEPVLFHRSLMENIRYGRPDATDEDVMDAAKKAHCHEFISELPDGYETKVGERGVKLSGGERQRVAIARAILKEAPILVLDEATSSLDSASEAYIQDALGELMKNKTVIVIAHRLSTIMKMDRIAVIENGTVVDSGSHRQLLKNVGVYSTLWNIQAGGFR